MGEMQSDLRRRTLTSPPARAALLAERLSDPLKPLAEVAYNYRWSWARDGAAVFRDVDPHRWSLCGQNPVLFLQDLRAPAQRAVERDPELQARIARLAAEVAADLARPDRPRPGVEGPVAFFCAEFGVHVSLPIYSGGLGVLAGDILKEASDQALPLIGIGLFYRRGYFRQRLDQTGWQHEYWLDADPDTLPLELVEGPDGRPLQVTVTLFGAPLALQVWRVAVGRVPLLLLDCELPQNDPVQRWTTSRLYEGNRAVRLAQYGVLGIGGARVLQALGIEPAVLHLNEGHPALAPLELAAAEVERGAALDDALERICRRVVFTTHTPVPAGNETYSREEFLAAFGDVPRRLGMAEDSFLDLARSDAGGEGPPGMSPLAIRLSRTRNGVSRLHGQVARGMWRPLFGAASDEEVPIEHVTNGAHVPTFLSEPVRALLDRYLGDGWLADAANPERWQAVRRIPNADLWVARSEARARLVRYMHQKVQADRLLRGETVDYVRAIVTHLDPAVLTLGFARRLATYKRLYLLFHDVDRTYKILGGEHPVQLVIAGKGHPNDEDGKDVVRRLFQRRRIEGPLAGRAAFLEDYDLDVGRQLVAGCDVWINLPRKPLEASGTSGMKASFNGALQLSVLDGWWAEAFNGTNGWGIPGDEDADHAVADANDADAFYDLLENEVIPQFYERDEHGVPHRWCERIKDALVTTGPEFSATRMLNEYAERIYPAPAGK